MKKQFVKTENYSRFVAAVRAVEQRGAAEAGMLLLHGLPGLGKSHTADRWAVDTGAIFLRAKVDWTPRYFLKDLAATLRTVDTGGSSQQLFGRLLDHLARSQQPLVIDEAEFTLARQAQVLEKVRDISDYAEITVVLIGMEKIQKDLGRHGQIHSRIAQAVEFQPATLADVAYACGLLSEVPMTEALCAEVHRLSAGRMREVLNIIATVERVARESGLETADVEHFRGVALSYDWQMRRPRTVRAGQTGKAGAAA